MHPAEVPISTIRDEAINLVRGGRDNGWWSNWYDYTGFIEQHDSEDEPVEEGMEAFGVKGCEDNDDDDDDQDNDGSQPSHGGDDADGGADDGSQPSRDGDDATSDEEMDCSQSSHGESGDDTDDGHGGGAIALAVEPAPFASEVSSGSQPSLDVQTSEDARGKAAMDVLMLLFAQLSATELIPP